MNSSPDISIREPRRRDDLMSDVPSLVERPPELATLPWATDVHGARAVLPVSSG
jgi:hypothetical protein